jgi:hypothetical protein
LRALVKLQADAPHGETAANVLNSLAMTEARGNFAEAELSYQQAIAGRSDFFGPQHPLTLSSTRKLTRMLVDSEQYASALPWLNDCLDLHNEVYGDDAGLTFSVRQYLARALAGLGRKDEAQSLLEDTIQLLSNRRGDDHAYTRAAQEQLREFLAE